MTHVLVIDDHADTRVLLGGLLEEAGYRTTTVLDCSAATAHDQEPLVVVVNQHLSGAGRRAVVLLTDDPCEDVLTVVSKPFDLPVVLAAVAKAAARLDG